MVPIAAISDRYLLLKKKKMGGGGGEGCLSHLYTIILNSLLVLNQVHGCKFMDACGLITGWGFVHTGGKSGLNLV